MADGIDLLADHYVPKVPGPRPLVLIRSPYGRKGIVSALLARPFAERGFQVLLQSCRGTFGSGGKFNPHHDERRDGLATLDWIARQPWNPGAIATYGLSYLGYVQWAIARDAPASLKALSTQVTMSHFAHMTYRGDSFMFENVLTWARLVSTQERPFAGLATMLRLLFRSDPLAKQWKKRPLLGLDREATGAPVQFYKDWLQHSSPTDPWWVPMDFRRSITEVDKPVTMTAGWYDIFTPGQIDDFVAMRAADRDVQITIGPWRHTDLGVHAVAIREAIAWFRAHLLGDRSGVRAKPVRLFVGGSKQWKEFDDWPPRAESQRWYLQPQRALSKTPPPQSTPDKYRYDPNDPTPSVGGPALVARTCSVDNRELEARPDVLTYTSEPLATDMEVIGPVRAEVWLASNCSHTDCFVRLCEVRPGGESMNITDGLQRLDIEGNTKDRPELATVDLWPTAHRFKRGNRIRVQVSSGAHPRWASNPGTGEPLGSATRVLIQHQAVFHDPAHLSSITLPVVS
jgi:putative CocE/NonD family hydrolase